MADNISNSNFRPVNEGFFELKFQENGVFIVIYPPVGKGKKVETRDVIEKLNRKQIRNFNKDIIDIAVLKAEKMPIKIADPQEELKLDSTLTIIISPDKMKGYITMSVPEGGRALTYNEILDAMGKQGLIYGINKTTLETIAKYPVFSEMICIAEGTPSSNGQNGKVEFFFDISKEKKPTILEDGRVDFRELNLIECVRAGQKLCSLVPPLPGVKGKTVMGTDLPTLDGKPANMPRGRNVTVSEDGQTLISNIDGQVNFIEGKVNVFSNYEVLADVDNSTGNIYFVGNVSVRGNVLSGFIVEAGGNVEVFGVVEGAITKAGGDIILRRGMQGQGKGTLVSGGDIIARYIENSSIEAKRDIKSESIMHSNIKCGNKLELSGRKGLLVGGTCKVGKEVIAKVIGSHMATVTDIEVGVDPTLRERYKAIKEEMATIENDLRKAEQAITLLKKLELAGLLTPEKQEIMVKSVRTKVFFSSKISELQEELSVLDSKLQQEAYGKIRAQSFIYPGTKVAIGSCMMYVKENLQYCSLYRDGADIRVGPIDK